MAFQTGTSINCTVYASVLIQQWNTGTRIARISYGAASDPNTLQAGPRLEQVGRLTC